MILFGLKEDQTALALIETDNDFRHACYILIGETDPFEDEYTDT